MCTPGLAAKMTESLGLFSMDMKLGPGEPSAGPWRVTPISDVVHLVFDADRKRHDRPWIVAVDGRSGSGKSTLANLLHQSVPASELVHTDDVAWHHSFFGWSDLLVENILKPLRNGKAVSYRPPGWQKHKRPGAIEVAAGLDLVVVEGVGASRTEVMPLIDRSLWVQSDLDETERRGIARDGGTEEARNFWHEWTAQEFEFLERQRPWERATVIVNGTPTQPHDRNTEIMVSQALR
jgi:uridine kinase